MRLLIENVMDCEFLTESNEGKKSYVVRGPFMMAEIQNRNGRVYPKGILVRECSRYVDTYVKHSRAYGELDHPASPNVNLKHVSHLITDLKEDGNNFIGTAKLVDTPSGQTAKALIDAGARLGVSSRGVGNIESRSGRMYVKEDFHLITPADLVADPSAPQAFVDSVFESAEWILRNGAWVERYIEETKEKIDESVRTRSTEEMSKAMEEAFSSFLKKLGDVIV